MSHGRSMTFRQDDCPPSERVRQKPVPSRKEIGVPLGCSHETIRHIENTAIEKIRRVMDLPPHQRSRRDAAQDQAIRAAARIIALADGNGELVTAMVQVIREQIVLAFDSGAQSRRRGTASTEKAA